MSIAVLRLLITGVCFVLLSLIFAFAARWVFDLEAVMRWISLQTWFKVLNPRLGRLLIAHGVPIIMAGIAANWIYGQSEDAARWLVWRATPPSILTELEAPYDLLELGIPDLPIFGRETELSELREFAESHRVFRWWWITGRDTLASGRVIRAWVEQRDEWDVGALKPGMTVDDFAEFDPRKPTIIIVENAAGRATEIRLMLTALGGRAQELDYSVRVLLSEHSIPQSLQSLQEQPKFLRHRYRDKALSVGKLPRNAISLLATAVEKVRGSSIALTANLESILLQTTGAEEFLLIAALDNLATNEANGWQTRDALLADQVIRLGARFERLGLDKGAFSLLALATITRGLPWDDAEPFQPGAGRLKRPLCEQLLGQDCRDAIPPVFPPLLGDAFVLETFGKLNKPQQEAIIDAAWEVSPGDFTSSLVRMHTYFPDNPQLAFLSKKPQGREHLGNWADAQATLLIFLPPGGARRTELLKTLRDLASQEGQEFDRVYARGLAGATILANLSSIRDLVDSLEDLANDRPDDRELQRSLATGLLNEVSFWLKFFDVYNQNKNYDVDVDRPLNAAFDKLQKIARRHKDDVQVQRNYAKGVANWMLYRFAANNYSTKLITSVESALEDIASRFPDDLDIQLRVIRFIVNVLINVPAMPRDEIESRLEILKLATEYHPDFPDFRDEWLEGLIAATRSYVRAKEWAEADNTLDQLKQGGAVFMARGLRTAIQAAGETRAWPEARSLMTRLQLLVEEYPARFEVIDNYVVAVSVTIDALGKQNQWGELQQSIGDVRTMAASTARRPSVDAALATALERALDHWGNGARITNVDAGWAELQAIARVWPEDLTIQRNFASGAVNSIYAYANAVIEAPTPENQSRLDQVWEATLRIADDLPDDQRVYVSVARAAVQSLQVWLALDRTEDRLAALSLLKAAAKRFPGDPDIAWLLRVVEDRYGVDWSRVPAKPGMEGSEPANASTS